MIILQSLDANSFCLEEISVVVDYHSLDKRSYQSYAVVVFAASNTSCVRQFSFIVFGDGLFKLVWAVAASSSGVHYSYSMLFVLLAVETTMSGSVVFEVNHKQKYVYFTIFRCSPAVESCLQFIFVFCFEWCLHLKELLDPS